MFERPSDLDLTSKSVHITPVLDYRGNLSWCVLTKTAAGSHESKFITSIENALTLVGKSLEEIAREATAEINSGRAT